ncbi:copper resistance CopC/CopD family protein [Rhizobium herbae]
MCRRDRRARFRFLCMAAMLLIFGWAMLIGAPNVMAHAVLVSSTPAQGERLSSSPVVMTLRFSEHVSRIVATLVGRDGHAIPLSTEVSGDQIAIRLLEPLARGAYALNWRTVSEDGHPVAASMVFAIGNEAVMGGFADGTASEILLKILTLATKFGLYLACLFGVGGTAYSIWIAETPPTKTLALHVVVGWVLGLSLIGLVGLEETGLSFAALATSEPWDAGLQGTLARSVALVSVSLGLALAARMNTTASGALSSLSLATLGLAFALTGHASGAGSPWLSFIAVAAHVLAVCFWVGALPGLWRLLAPPGPEQKRALCRFSSAIPYSVAVMTVAGGYLAYIQVESPGALINTDYGNILLLKLTLVALTLGLGAWNRIFLTQQVLEGRPSAARKMKILIAIELGLIVGVLAVTSLWRFTPPPRALALRPVLASIHLHDPAAMATLSFATKPDLSFNVDLSLQTADFNPLDTRELRLRMSAADGSVAAFEVPLKWLSPGRWAARAFQAPCNCQWAVRVDVLVSDFDMITLDGQLKLISSK